MFSDTEWALVTELVRDHLLKTVAPYDRLQPLFPAAFVAGLSLTTVPGENAHELVRVVRGAGLRDDDPPVLRLLQELLVTPSLAPLPDSTRVRDMLDRGRAMLLAEQQRRADGADPFTTSVLAGKTVFMDRHELRDKLRAIHQGAENKVFLQISGTDDSGKTYSARLIEHLAAECGFRPAAVYLDDTGTPEEVIETLGWIVAPDAEPLPRDDDLRKWYGRASMWLVAKAANQPQVTWWFVVDGLNHLPANSEVWDLVHRLAMAVDRYGQGRIRLILLGYSGAFDHSLRGRYETAHFDVLEREDVHEFFTKFFDGLYATRPLNQRPAPDQVAAEVEDTVEQVLVFANERCDEDSCFMAQLGLAVEGVVREFAP